ncbi:hypothetical protein KZX46_12330 [Polymorphobacter sp. PAMC 29334]|uniref:hypothetical protein n=1 Tax=Polymorphobacter sp. PAMC 29334 TaxID=2862331 RepID=UPI001C74A6F5|nr:hypothetical protein [Polymorphobacter sp. PAMC 29334]QYE36628.1 hypothetical protein KZX46_12330 [Polymorphobacter sp. PAMC 29334]
MVLGLVLALAMNSAPAQAISPVPPTYVPDPARLAAARELIDVAFPQDKRSILPAIWVIDAALSRARVASTELAGHWHGDPRADRIFDNYIFSAQATARTFAQAQMVIFYDTIGKAYERQFTLTELATLKTFFQTPTGKLVADMIMNSQVVEAQQAILANATVLAQTETQAMDAELRALPELHPGALK